MSLPPVTVRPAVVADAATIARLRVEAWRATYAGIVEQPFLDAMSIDRDTKRWTASLAEPGPGRFTLVACRSGTVVGFASGGPDRDGRAGTGEIYAIYADPAQLRTGVGAALLPATLDALGAAGDASAGLWVAEGNDRARRFYERFGLERTGERRTLDAGGPVPEVRYGIALPIALGTR